MVFVPLAAAALAWFLLHAAVAGSPLRGWLVGRLGDKAYRSGFSLASIGALWWLVTEYRGAPFHPLWLTPTPLRWVPLLLVPPACVLLVGAFTVPSPTAVGGEKYLAGGDAARGMLRLTRHPFLWSVVLWSLAHLLVNPDAGSLIFFSSLGLTAWRGTTDIDKKRRRTHGVAYAAFEAQTSNVPAAAVLAGKNRLVLREVWLPLLGGLVLALAAAYLHPLVFGRVAIPDFYG